MGNKVSSSLSAKDINNISFNFLSKNTTTTSGSTIATQKMSLSNIKAYCNLDITQEADLTVNIIQKIDTQQTIDLQNQLINKLNDDINNAIDNKQGWLALPNENQAKTNISKEVSNIVRNSVTIEKVNSLISNIQSKQIMSVDNIVIDPCGFTFSGNPNNDKCSESCPITQSLIAKLVSYQITKDLSNVINDNKVINDMFNQIKQYLKNDQKGFNDLIKDFFTSLSTPLLIIGVCIVFIILIYAFFGLKAYKSNTTKKAMNIVKNNPQLLAALA